MIKLLELRSLLRTYYQKFQMVIDPILKFLLAFVTLRLINSSLAYEGRLEKTVVVLLVSLLCAFTPPSILVFFSMIFSVLHIVAASPLMAIIVAVVFVILYCFFLRFAPQYGYAVVGIPILYTLNIPYFVPILLGLTANPITMLPSACGVIVYYMFDIIKKHTVLNASYTTDDVLPLYTEVFEDITGRTEILGAAFVFALVIIVVYVVRKLRMEYASEIAILAGAVVNVFGFLLCDLKFGTAGAIGKMILGTVLSALLAFVALFFKRVLDYTAVENVQFEDDDYFYYVKAVPKIEIGLQAREIKHINEKRAASEDEDEDDYEEILDEETGEVFFRPKNGSGTGGQVRRMKGGRPMPLRRPVRSAPVRDEARAEVNRNRPAAEWEASERAASDKTAPAAGKRSDAAEPVPEAMQSGQNRETGETVMLNEEELIRMEELAHRKAAMEKLDEPEEDNGGH
ncbi:MAG: hypothetical protein K2N94_01020 [Lachnospiraceae bacterium]|nr:hypothetical protein [Lachnospiraceae bacterium]